MKGTKTIVFSRTLQQRDYPKVTIVADGARETLTALRAEPGKDIWLFGGGALFRSLLSEGLVDSVEVAVMPVLLGGGIPLLPAPASLATLKLTGHKLYKTGIVLLEYSVANSHPDDELLVRFSTFICHPYLREPDRRVKKRIQVELIAHRPDVS